MAKYCRSCKTYSYPAAKRCEFCGGPLSNKPFDERSRFEQAFGSD